MSKRSEESPILQRRGGDLAGPLCVDFERWRFAGGPLVFMTGGKARKRSYLSLQASILEGEGRRLPFEEK